MKSRLSRITYGDFMQLFDDAIDIPSIAGGIDNYLQKHGNEELFRSIILAEVSEDEELVNMDINPYMTHNLAFAKEYCQRFYLLRVIKAIDDILQGQKKSKNILKVAISPRMSAEACVYKIWNIVQLSNRLGRPVVMEAVDKIQQESSKCAAIQKEKLAVLDRIQPYGYYVEARINCTNKVKLSLNQVIETATDNDTLQRSTLSIKDVSYQASDMYDSIFDAAWNIIDEHMANPQCKSLQQDDPLPLDCYKMIRADFIDIIKSNFESKSNAVQNLDEVIYQYNAKPNCACDLMVTHRLVINTGLLSYLRRIASEIAGPLKSNAMFGDYRISCLYITGEFLYKWIEKGNPTYGELIWDQLQKAINAELYSKQLRIHLMMVKSMVLEDKALNYKPFKLERYKQVLSKHYFLQIDSHQKDDFRIYHDKGDHWIEVPFAFELDYVTCWTIPILPVDDQDQRFQAVCKDNFYIVISPMITDRAYCRIRFYTLSKDRLEDVDDPEVLSANLTANIRLHSLKCEQQRCTFPLEVFVSPCSYMSAIDIQMRLGKGFNSSNAWGYHGVAYPERLTLQKMTFE
ncbi:hypothetical protein FB192DRAFT_1441068 [Mucor lusitanicus]|nr:hypothetical protein FB192DRAFT_1441068 [Mucor lusitanicus]